MTKHRLAVLTRFGGHPSLLLSSTAGRASTVEMRAVMMAVVPTVVATASHPAAAFGGPSGPEGVGIAEAVRRAVNRHAKGDVGRPGAPVRRGRLRRNGRPRRKGRSQIWKRRRGAEVKVRRALGRPQQQVRVRGRAAARLRAGAVQDLGHGAAQGHRRRGRAGHAGRVGPSALSLSGGRAEKKERGGEGNEGKKRTSGTEEGAGHGWRTLWLKQFLRTSLGSSVAGRRPVRLASRVVGGDPRP